MSSIRFTNSIIGNLGAPLRDGLLEDDSEDEDNMNTEGIEASDVQKNDEELHIGALLLEADNIKNVAGPSRISPQAPKS